MQTNSRRLAATLSIVPVACALAGLVPTEASAQSARLAAKTRNLAPIMNAIGGEGMARVMVEFSVPARGDSDPPTGSIRAAQDDILGRAVGKSALADRVHRLSNVGGFVITATLAELDRLAADQRVVAIYPDYQLKLALNETIPIVRARQANNAGARGAGQRVVVMDTGIFGNLDDLAVDGADGACFSTRSSAYASSCRGGILEDHGLNAGRPCQFSIDDCGHGAHVGGIVAMLRNGLADEPHRGVAPSAHVIPFNLTSKEKSTGHAVILEADMVRALDWLDTNIATLGNVAAINLSFSRGMSGGGPFPGNCDSENNIVTQILRRLRQRHDVAPVAAAGNEGFVTGINFPACIDYAVAVSSSNKQDQIAPNTNIGAMTDLLAPGEGFSVDGVLSLFWDGAFARKSGTSQAAAHISGAFAAIRSYRSALSVNVIQRALQNHGVSLSRGAHTKTRIDLFRAVNSL